MGLLIIGLSKSKVRVMHNQSYITLVDRTFVNFLQTKLNKNGGVRLGEERERKGGERAE